jgi:hypothetical protein
LNACITPAVKLIWPDGITHAIARVGNTNTARTSPMARKMAFRVIASWVAQFVDVDGGDLDAGVGEEAVHDQNDACHAMPRRQDMASRRSIT